MWIAVVGELQKGRVHLPETAPEDLVPSCGGMNGEAQYKRVAYSSCTWRPLERAKLLKRCVFAKFSPIYPPTSPSPYPTVIQINDHRFYQRS